MNKIIKKIKNLSAKNILVSCFWFVVGFIFTGFFLASFILIYFQNRYKQKIYPGVFIDNIYVGEKTKSEIENLLNKKNEEIGKNTFILRYKSQEKTVSGSEIGAGYNSQLLAEQAEKLGRSGNILSDFYIVSSAYLNGLFLPSSHRFLPEKIKENLDFLQKDIHTDPQDAIFTVSGNRVVAFRQSADGKTIDFEALEDIVDKKVFEIIKNNKKNEKFSVEIPIKILKPTRTTQQANDLGISEIIGEGKSYFRGSIQNRIHNIALASSRLNGILIKPSETFSFNQALGDVSRYTGYKESYIIKEGRTVLGDGGGVCQVSTTLFRAILAAGLPITERHPHSYRVGYYEQESDPGIDATVYGPTIDLRFKNDTQNYILIQTVVDPESLGLTFILYGKKDGRKVTVTKPAVTSQIPPPVPLYQDDPNLKKGVIRQIDFEAWGATVTFGRTVEKNGKVIISDLFKSAYSPWQAVYLRGTKE